jgi:hypothetical protein
VSKVQMLLAIWRKLPSGQVQQKPIPKVAARIHRR